MVIDLVDPGGGAVEGDVGVFEALDFLRTAYPGTVGVPLRPVEGLQGEEPEVDPVVGEFAGDRGDQKRGVAGVDELLADADERVVRDAAVEPAGQRRGDPPLEQPAAGQRLGQGGGRGQGQRHQQGQGARRQGGPGASHRHPAQAGGEQARAAAPPVGRHRQEGQAEEEHEGHRPGPAAPAVHGGELQVGHQRGEHRRVGMLPPQPPREQGSQDPEEHGEHGDEPGQGEHGGDAGARDVEGVGQFGAQRREGGRGGEDEPGGGRHRDADHGEQHGRQVDGGHDGDREAVGEPGPGERPPRTAAAISTASQGRPSTEERSRRSRRTRAKRAPARPASQEKR